MTRDPAALLSVLVVNYNSWAVCVDALRSLRDHPPSQADGRPVPYEVIVVDNCSPQRDADAEAELRALLDRMNGRLILHDENGGYGKGMNLAWSHSKGELVLVCNPDLIFLPGCLATLLRSFEASPEVEVGAVAPTGFWDKALQGRLPPNILPTLFDLLFLTAASVSPKIRRQYSKRRTRSALRVWDAREDIRLPMLSGCCFLMRRQTIEELGFFDERFPLYYEDTDLSMRLRKAGLAIVQVAEAKLVHLYNKSGQTDNDLAMERYFISRRLYYRKWYGALGGFLYDLCQRFQATSWAKRRSQLSTQRAIFDLGASPAPPIIRFDRSYERLLVEVALDSNFYLAAAIFGSGRTWTVGMDLFSSFGLMTYYFRVLDISNGRTPSLIGVYSYTRAPETICEPDKEPSLG